MTGKGIPLLAVLEPCPNPAFLPVPPFGAPLLVLVVTRDVAVWITGVAIAGGVGHGGLRVLVDATFYEVGLSGAGRRHDDVAGNDLEEIHIVS